ncbi:hypothetical protein MA794_004443 [Vibrio vulnificus]|nr:hypothetical protein [Vibrio vulnificus]
MSRFFIWFSSSIIFPLTPMGVVWFLKGLETDNFSFSNIAGSDLLFASAMVCVITLIRLRNVSNNKELQESLASVFLAGLIFTLIGFTLALVYQVQGDLLLLKHFKVVQEALSKSTDVRTAIHGIDPSIGDSKVAFFRFWGLVLGVIVFVTAATCNFKYNLDKA